MRNPESETRNLKSGVRNLEFGTRNPEHEMWSPKSEASDPEPHTRNPKLGTPSPTPQTPNLHTLHLTPPSTTHLTSDPKFQILNSQCRTRKSSKIQRGTCTHWFPVGLIQRGTCTYWFPIGLLLECLLPIGNLLAHRQTRNRKPECRTRKRPRTAKSSPMGCASCIVKSFRSRSSFISSPL